MSGKNQDKLICHTQHRLLRTRGFYSDYSKKVPSSIHPWLPLQINPSWGSSPSPPPADKKKSATLQEKH